MSRVNGAFALVAGLALGLAALPLAAAPGGKLGTLERGVYACEMPGDARSERGVAVPEEGFEIANGSTYLTTSGNGSYLRTGDRVEMTSGPRKGDRYMLKSERFLRKLGDDGMPNGLRCVRRGQKRS